MKKIGVSSFCPCLRDLEDRGVSKTFTCLGFTSPHCVFNYCK